MALQFPQVFHSGGVTLTHTEDEIYVEFQKPLSFKEFDVFTRKLGLLIVDPEVVIRPVPDVPSEPVHRAWLKAWQGTHFDRFFTQVLADERVRLASPVYHRADLLPLKVGLTFSDLLIVCFQVHVSDAKKKKIIKNLGAEDVSREPNLLGDNVRRIKLLDPKHGNAHLAGQEAAQLSKVRSAGPDWLQLSSPLCAIPNDTYFGEQWHLTRIAAPDGWDIETGDSELVIAVIDFGCDLDHEDLATKYGPAADWINVLYPGIDFSDEVEDSDYDGLFGHGTCVAGIAAAHTEAGTDNVGVAGTAWGCRIMPIRALRHSGGFWEIYESRIAEAINHACSMERESVAAVVNMSFYFGGPHDEIDEAIVNAHAEGVVLVAAAGNGNMEGVRYPANHELVIAVGASDEEDRRKRPESPDGECWGSVWGSELGVVAPGVNIWTTDRMGTEGYNNNHGGERTESEPGSCVGYATTGDAEGNYYAHFNGTSAATPQVAGLAALLRSHYSYLRNEQIRNIIERTAEKVGGYGYISDADHSNGPWNEEMGYGRINVFRALDFADVYIKDNPAHDGSMYFGGDFYSESDIVVRAVDDGVFAYEGLTRDETNYIYVRVNNGGAATARNIQVSVRAVPYAGTEFRYARDWTVIDETHLEPDLVEPYASELEAGATLLARFSLSAEQVAVLDGWTHPCLLAKVESDNDYCEMAEATHTWEHNNLAQRNISFASVTVGAPSIHPFISGHEDNLERYMEVLVDRSRLPRHIELLLDPWETKDYFPALKLDWPQAQQSFTFLDRTRLATTLGGCDGILTLEPGSSFQCGNQWQDSISLQGAELVERDGKGLIAIRADEAVIGLQKQPGERRQMSLTFQVPEDAKAKDRYRIEVRQRNIKRQVVGGLAFVANVIT